MKSIGDDVLPSAWFVKITADDEKRRSGKEREASKRLSNVLCSDKIADNDFCQNVLPKIVDRYAGLVEENSTKFLNQLAELYDYELRVMPPIWAYSI